MSTWSQVFDDDRVLEEARCRIRGALVGFALVSGALVSAAPLATLSPRFDATRVALLCAALLSLSAGLVLVRLAREYRRLWRVELSVSRVVGYDAAGRRQTLSWARVDRVDVGTTRLTVTGHDSEGRAVRLVAATTMSSFTAFAHRVVEYAEAHGRTVSVEGTPIADLDLVELIPSLCEPAGTTA